MESTNRLSENAKAGRQNHFSRLSVIIPALNEEETIGSVIRSALAQENEALELEIIVVDDGSSDGTSQEVLKHIRRDRDRLIRHEKRLGKGRAVRSAQPFATGDYIVIQDADLEYDPADWPRLLHPLRTGKADVVFGTRFGGVGEKRVLYFWHTVGNKVLTVFSNVFTNLNLSDMETGYKVFSRDVFGRLAIRENGFGMEPEITARVAKMRAKVYEVPISYYGRTYQEGKKINWKDGLWAIWCIVRYAFTRNPKHENFASERQKQ